jgi:hypothetical protein
MQTYHRFGVPAVLLVVLAFILIFWTRREEPKRAGLKPATVRLEPVSQPGSVVAPTVVFKAPEPDQGGIRSAEDPRRFKQRAQHDASFAIVTDIYSGFVKDVGLSETETKQFLELVCDERLSALDAVLTARAKGLNYHDDIELENLTMAAATLRDADIRQLLGTDNYAKFADYRSTAMVRSTINQLCDRSADAGAPIADAQITQLSQVYLTLQSPENARRAPIKAVLQLIGMPVTEQMIDASRSILSAPQLAALVEVRNAQHSPARDTVGSPGVSMTRSGNP